MANNENDCSSLVSIIKIEPEEFQTSEKCSRSSLDDVLRLKAKIFSDPVVFVEQVLLETKATRKVSKHAGIENEEQFEAQSFIEIARKGNAGKSCFEPHTCSLCDKAFSRRDSLKRHLRMTHVKGPKLFCDFCPKIFHIKLQIAQHMRTHMVKAFACNICGFKTARKHYLEQHKKTHSKKERCKICNKQVASLRLHLWHHKKKACSVCGKLISTINMKEHMKRVHDNEKWKCLDCDFTSSSKEALRSHKLQIHYDGKLHRCHCGSVFKSKDILNRHNLRHDSKKVTCEVCERKFNHLDFLKRHQKKIHSKTHGSVKVLQFKVVNSTGPFTCDKCGVKREGRKSFRNHFRWNHSPKSLFSCDLCPKTFNRKQLEDHMQSQHFKVNPFTCNVCGHKSNAKYDLKKHMLQHEPKAKCKVCHKMVANMNDHMRNHVKVKCQICGKDFSKNSLRHHIKRLHKTCA